MNDEDPKDKMSKTTPPSRSRIGSSSSVSQDTIQTIPDDEVCSPLKLSQILILQDT